MDVLEEEVLVGNCISASTELEEIAGKCRKKMLHATYINCHMTHNTCVVRESDIFAFVYYSIFFCWTFWGRRLIVHNISTLDVDFHSSWIDDSVLQTRAGGVGIGGIVLSGRHRAIVDVAAIATASSCSLRRYGLG